VGAEGLEPPATSL